MADSGLSTVPSWLPVGKEVDSKTFCYKTFLDDIWRTYPWGLNDTVSFGYVDMVHKVSHHVKFDQDMIAMFEKFVDTKVIPMIIRIHGINEEVDELDHTLAKVNIDVPVTSLAMDTYLANPFSIAEHVGVDEEGIYLDGDEEAAAALPCLGDHIPPLPPKKTNSKTKGKASSAAPDSPAMGTRSKNKSPAMNTRSKTKLMD
uniref:Uncharacterized protein n=2 Tax=Leersia perrieri TaxID=77586 RepID=A0A0D9XY65_9ORYZ